MDNNHDIKQRNFPSVVLPFRSQTSTIHVQIGLPPQIIIQIFRTASPTFSHGSPLLPPPDREIIQARDNDFIGLLQLRRGLDRDK